MTENGKKKDKGRSGRARSSENPQPPIDRKHLSEFAMGDRALEHRFLRLFTEHAGVDLARMEKAAVHDFQKAAHSLKSSASSIGAWRIVDYVEQILEMDERLLNAGRDKILKELSRRVEDAMAYIRQIIEND